MQQKEIKEVKVLVSDPSAIGLLGLAMVTLVASTQKLGLTTGTSYIVPWAIFLGALAQIYAGITDAKHNNTFGSTAFCGYGFFWLAVAMSWMIKSGVFGETMASGADPSQLGVAFIGYLIFTLYMTIAACETNKVLLMIFILIDFLFLGLALSSFNIAYGFTHTMAGISELLIALLSFYGSAANVLNKQFDKVFLPIGKPLGIFKS